MEGEVSIKIGITWPSNCLVIGIVFKFNPVGMKQPDGSIPTVDTRYDKEYVYLYSEFDPNWHINIESGTDVAFYPPDWKPELWLLNGNTFPDTLKPFTYDTDKRREFLYDTYVNVTFKQTYALRLINMGYQAQPVHQHGWHMNVVGTDARPLGGNVGSMPGMGDINGIPYMKYTLNVASGIPGF